MTIINTNLAAMKAQSGSRMAQMGLDTAMERLSTGLRINSAKDDAAGFAIAQRMTADVRGLSFAIRNAGDGISLAQTAETAMGEITNMLQRMRELSVQAANGTISGDDRQALQAEVTQLVGEIDNVASRTSFNGIKLLDGSSNRLALQTGSRAGQTVTLGIGSARAGDLGTGSVPGLTATGAFETSAANLLSNQALQANDLRINGVVVGSSRDADDSLSSVAKAASAIAKAAAINRLSDQTGVRAVVGATTMTGTAMTAAALTGTVTINGVTTGSITTTTNAAASRTAVVDAINLISGQTGVRAIDMGDSNLGIRLEAADGRNIELSLTTLTAAATGLKVGAQADTFSLVSDSGGPIVVDSVGAGRLSRAGLAAGSFDRGVSTVSTDARAVATAANGSDTRVLNTGDLVLNGVSKRRDGHDHEPDNGENGQRKQGGSERARAKAQRSGNRHCLDAQLGQEEIGGLGGPTRLGKGRARAGQGRAGCRTFAGKGRAGWRLAGAARVEAVCQQVMHSLQRARRTRFVVEDGAIGTGGCRHEGRGCRRWCICKPFQKAEGAPRPEKMGEIEVEPGGFPAKAIREAAAIFGHVLGSHERCDGWVAPKREGFGTVGRRDAVARSMVGNRLEPGLVDELEQPGRGGGGGTRGRIEARFEASRVEQGAEVDPGAGCGRLQGGKNGCSRPRTTHAADIWRSAGHELTLAKHGWRVGRTASASEQIGYGASDCSPSDLPERQMMRLLDWPRGLTTGGGGPT